MQCTWIVDPDSVELVAQFTRIIIQKRRRYHSVIRIRLKFAYRSSTGCASAIYRHALRAGTILIEQMLEESE